MTIVLFILGVAILLTLMLDVHMTVFVPRGGAGIVARHIYSGGWAVWRWIGNRLFTGARCRWWQAQLGPALVPLTVMAWGTMLVVGFTLLYTPWLEGFSVSPPESGPLPDWAMLLYYSGYSAVTLGVGDIVPDGTTPRLLAFVEAGLGFALFTASISYLLSVYTARNQATTLALTISHLVGRRDGQDPIDLLVGTVTSGAAFDLSDWLHQISTELSALVELSGQYPLLHYFHEPSDDRAIPMAMRDLMELTTLCRTLLDPETYPALAHGPSVQAVYRLGLHFLEESGPGQSPNPTAVERERRNRYEVARRRLENAGISLRGDAEAWRWFEGSAGAWDLKDDGMRAALGYRTEQDAT